MELSTLPILIFYDTFHAVFKSISSTEVQVDSFPHAIMSLLVLFLCQFTTSWNDVHDPFIFLFAHTVGLFCDSSIFALVRLVFKTWSCAVVIGLSVSIFKDPFCSHSQDFVSATPAVCHILRQLIFPFFLLSIFEIVCALKLTFAYYSDCAERCFSALRLLLLLLLLLLWLLLLFG